MCGLCCRECVDCMAGSDGVVCWQVQLCVDGAACTQNRTVADDGDWETRMNIVKHTKVPSPLAALSHKHAVCRATVRVPCSELDIPQ